MVGGVVELEPVVLLEVFIDEDRVAGTHLVDADGVGDIGEQFLVRQFLEDGDDGLLHAWVGDVLYVDFCGFIHEFVAAFGDGGAPVDV